MVRTVAVCGGSGDSLFDAARASGADAYVTADLRHHPAGEAREHRPDGRPYLVDVAHWASEWPWLERCADLLRESWPTSRSTSAPAAPTPGRSSSPRRTLPTPVIDPARGSTT